MEANILYPKTLLEELPVLYVNELESDGKVVFPKRFFELMDFIKNEIENYAFYENGDIIDISVSFNFFSESFYELQVYLTSGHILLENDKDKIRESLNNLIIEKFGLYVKLIFDH